MTLSPRVATAFATVALIVAVSLSIHVVMLQVLWIPYPDMSGLGRWARAYPVSQAVGIVWLAAVTAPAFRRLHSVWRWLAVAALFATMNGVMRNALMQGVTTLDPLTPWAGLARPVLLDLILAAMAVAAVSLTRGAAARTAATAVVAAVSLFLVLPAMGALLAPVARWAAVHARPEVLVVPYGMDVLLPSYISFAETVVACLAARWLAHFAPCARDPHARLRYALLVLLVRGTLVTMVVFGPMIGRDPIDGMLSASQFFLQDLAMIVLIQLAYERRATLFGRTARPVW